MRLSALLAADASWDERDLPVGNQEPTHRLVPDCEYSHGQAAIAFAEYCGYDLYDFQKQGLVDKLGENTVQRRDGTVVQRWAAQETADVISRRNGKSVEIEVLILFGLFVLGERKIMYTAHRDDTALEVFNNVVAAIQRTPKLWAELIDKGPRRANGQRSITLKNGAVCYFRTRTTDSARGQGYDRLILDESQALTAEELAALMPLVTGATNAQLNYAGSAGGLGAVIQGKLWRSFEKAERGLAYRGWHADLDTDFDDLDLIARVNPRLGRGLSYEFVAKEFARMTRPDFGRERCGAATYPREEGGGWVIPEVAWHRGHDDTSQIAPEKRPAFVLEADAELELGTITVAGRRTDGAMHAENVQHDPGVGWMVARAKDLQDEHHGAIWLDPKGPCGFMLGDLREAGVQVHTFEPEDLKDAWTWLYTNANPQPDPADPNRTVPPPGVYHRSNLTTLALAAAELRKLGDRHTLRRTVSSGVNQGPIVGAMLACFAVVKAEREQPPEYRGRPGKAAPRDGAGRQARRPTREPRRRRPPGDVDVRTTGF